MLRRIWKTPTFTKTADDAKLVPSNHETFLIRKIAHVNTQEDQNATQIKENFQIDTRALKILMGMI